MAQAHKFLTLVKFQRCIKCLATSLAAFPCTTEEMSCQGILGVVYLSIKSMVEHSVKKQDCKHPKSTEKPAFNNTINLGKPGLMIIEMKKENKSSQAVNVWLTIKRLVQLNPVFVDEVAVVFAVPESCVSHQLSHSCLKTVHWATLCTHKTYKTDQNTNDIL